MASDPSWELVSKKQYQHGLFYIGHAQETVAEFELPPEQIPGVAFMAGKLANAIERSVIDNGGKMLSVEVYQDKAEWYNSRWLVRVNAHGSPLPWPLIIKGIIALMGLIGLIVLAHSLLEVKDEWWTGPAMIVGGIGIVVIGGILLAGGSARYLAPVNRNQA
jgi:hypothetical protein